MPVPADAISDGLAVLLIDDHRMFTDLLALTLDMQDDLHCVGAAHTVQDGLQWAASEPFDVAVVDLQLPEGGGLGLIGPLLELRPAARIIVLTAHPRADLAQRALDTGAAAFLAKDGALEEILAAIREADADHPMVCAAARSVPGGPRLTHREWDVLRGLGNGLTAHQMAGSLGMSLHTVRYHIKSVMAKLEVHSQLEAVVAAERLGLIEVGHCF